MDKRLQRAPMEDAFTMGAHPLQRMRNLTTQDPSLDLFSGEDAMLAQGGQSSVKLISSKPKPQPVEPKTEMLFNAKIVERDLVGSVPQESEPVEKKPKKKSIFAQKLAANKGLVSSEGTSFPQTFEVEVEQ